MEKCGTKYILDMKTHGKNVESNSHMFATFNPYIIQAFFGGGGGEKEKVAKNKVIQKIMWYAYENCLF